MYVMIIKCCQHFLQTNHQSTILEFRPFRGTHNTVHVSCEYKALLTFPPKKPSKYYLGVPPL